MSVGSGAPERGIWPPSPVLWADHSSRPFLFVIVWLLPFALACPCFCSPFLALWFFLFVAGSAEWSSVFCVVRSCGLHARAPPPWRAGPASLRRRVRAMARPFFGGGCDCTCGTPPGCAGPAFSLVARASVGPLSLLLSFSLSLCLSPSLALSPSTCQEGVVLIEGIFKSQIIWGAARRRLTSGPLLEGSNVQAASCLWGEPCLYSLRQDVQELS